MQKTLVFIKARKWLLIMVGIIFIAMGIKSLFSHPQDVSDYAFSFFEVIGGISYILLGFRLRNSNDGLTKPSLPSTQKKKVFLIFGIILIAYVVIVLKCVYLK